MSIDFEKLLNFKMDFPGFSLSVESWAIKTFLDHVERNIEIAVNDFRVISSEKLKGEQGLYPENEIAYEYVEIDVACETHIPRFFRASSVIMLWAFFESYIKDFAQYLKKERGLDVSVTDIKGNNPIDGFAKYFRYIAGVDLGWSDDVKQRLIDLNKLRNLLAHSNGRLEAASEKVRSEVRYLERIDGLDVREDCLIVSHEYLDSTKKLVFDILDKFVVTLHGHLHTN